MGSAPIAVKAVAFISAAVAAGALIAVAALFLPGVGHTLPAALAPPGKPVPIPRAGEKVFSEGVAADRDGNVYFSEMGTNQRTMRFGAGGDSARAWRQASDAPNGMWLDSANRLIICQKNAIVRVAAGETFDDITDTLFARTSHGHAFNDVTGDSRDNLYFTDFNGRSVFYRDAATGAVKEMLSSRPKPNGIEWDEERGILYVCEYEAGMVAAYAVAKDHSLAGRRDFAAVPDADGIALDSAGNVYVVSLGSGVHVFSPDGVPLGEIPLRRSRLTNLGFGGPGFRTLYMITDRGLYALPMSIRGYLPR